MTLCTRCCELQHLCRCVAAGELRPPIFTPNKRMQKRATKAALEIVASAIANAETLHAVLLKNCQERGGPAMISEDDSMPVAVQQDWSADKWFAEYKKVEAQRAQDFAELIAARAEVERLKGQPPAATEEPSKDTHEAIEALMCLAGVSMESGWDWNELAWKFDLVRWTLKERYAASAQQAVEIERLRGDKARLDWVLETIDQKGVEALAYINWSLGDGRMILDRPAIDAAISAKEGM